jgi:transposase InsO family protein
MTVPAFGCGPSIQITYDFVADRTVDGRPLKMLTVIDELSRQCMAITVARRLNADDVSAALTELFVKHGPPAFIRSNNGGEFAAGVVRGRLQRLQVKTLYIEPGTPWENGYNESFKGKLRCSTANCSTHWPKPNILSRPGGNTSIRSDRTARSATDRQPRRPSCLAP